MTVTNPGEGVELAALAGANVHIVEGFKPLHDHWVARGYQVSTSVEGECEAAIVCLPRAKGEARATIAAVAARCSGTLIIDGQKTDGVDSLLREIRARVTVFGPISKAHGKLFWFTPTPGLFEDWQAGPALTEGGFWTAPGVFSADAVDPASALLAAALPARLGKTVADLGAGWGYLSAHVLTREEVETVHLVEAHHMALECARRNVTDLRARFHWADVRQWTPEKKLDAVVMNPPFHSGRAAEPSLGQSFLAAASGMLAPHGQLWMVANRHLPYETTLGAHFVKVTEVAADARFKLFHASRPRRTRG